MHLYLYNGPNVKQVTKKGFSKEKTPVMLKENSDFSPQFQLILFNFWKFSNILVYWSALVQNITFESFKKHDIKSIFIILIFTILSVASKLNTV